MRTLGKILLMIVVGLSFMTCSKKQNDNAKIAGIWHVEGAVYKEKQVADFNKSPYFIATETHFFFGEAETAQSGLNYCSYTYNGKDMIMYAKNEEGGKAWIIYVLQQNTEKLVFEYDRDGDGEMIVISLIRAK